MSRRPSQLDRYREALQQLGSEWIEAERETEDARRLFEGVMSSYEPYILPKHRNYSEEDGLAATVGLGSREAQDALESGASHATAVRRVRESQDIKINGLARWIVSETERRMK